MVFAALMEKISGFLNNLKDLFAKIGAVPFRCVSQLMNFFGALKKKTAASEKANFRKESGIRREQGIREKAGLPGMTRITAFGRKIFDDAQKKPLLFGLGGLAALALILLIVALALHAGHGKKTMVENAASIPLIPPEDLFIPSEPDFLPVFLFEREKRNFWSLDDIRIYWKLPQNPERWKKEISSAIDKLMEGVP